MWETYYTPTSLNEALTLLAEYGPEARIIAGGTDLLIELRRDLRQARALIDVTRIDDLDQLHVDGSDRIHIGPTATHNQIAASRLLLDKGFPLAQACWQVGTPQLRNRGTVAGNMVTASPANDTITALWALDADVILTSLRGERTLSFPDFYQGVRQTVMAPDEMVTGVAFPAMNANQRGTFAKLGLRRSHAIALVNTAAVLTFDGDRVTRARITLGSVAPTIIRAREAEEMLEGKVLDARCIAEAAKLAAQAAVPIDDVRGSAEYRRDMVEVLARRALDSLRSGATGTDHTPDAPKLWGTSDGHFAPLSGEGLTHRGSGTEPIECTVNGQPVAVTGAADKTLLDMLREDLGLTGTKEGCGEGECGACTVWLDGIAVLACLVAAPRAHGAQIVTVEGLAQGDRLHPVQQAFVDEGAVQCGYCTPGFVMSGANLLEEMTQPSQAQIIAGLHGNLCRCTGYYKIVRAIEKAAEEMSHVRR